MQLFASTRRGQRLLREQQAGQPTHYSCKKCGGKAPYGVGYAPTFPEHTPENDPVACPCGYSVRTITRDHDNAA